MASNLIKKWMLMSVRLKKLKNVFSADSGMHMNEIWVLGKIDNAVRSSGCGLGNTQIQKDMQITKSAVSQIIDSLVEKGYVDRTPDAEDRRRMCVTITPSGQQVLRQLTESANDLADKVAANMGEEKIQQMFALLNEFIDGFIGAQSEPEGDAANDSMCPHASSSDRDAR
ncbi:MAG TPA: MarR family winged helix-turn-helix transcriptional regulator [Clostridia bacterium]|nr:MarR family winged helix-turn-helix transcriptional regulator [Clostridia bacterium]